jgi:phosphatidylinositol alpha-1,6-mannosyltransferase
MSAAVIKLTRLLLKERISFVHAHWAMPNSIIALIARTLSRSRIKILTSFPGSDVTVIKQSGWIGKVLARLIARSDYLSCNSSDLKDDLIDAGIRSEKIDYVIYGVNNDAINFDMEGRRQVRTKLSIGDDTIVLLMVGRFVPKKGFLTGIKAMQRLKSRKANVHLLLIGSGVEEREYKKVIAETGTRGLITFLGEVPHPELQKYYSACDIFLMPSERLPSDGLNVVVVEAMACGRPIVASYVGGNNLVVFDGVNGYLHHSGDPQDLADKVFALIQNERGRFEMGNKSRKLVDEHFNCKSIAKYYLDRYHHLVQRETQLQQNMGPGGTNSRTGFRGDRQ